MGSEHVKLSDLARDPATVARGLAAWRRGDRDEAVLATLRASARDLHARAYTLWAWSGRAHDGAPAWALAVPASDAEGFRPKGPARILARCLEAVVHLDADPQAVRLEDWRGCTCVVFPGGDEDLAGLMLAEAHPAPARAVLAPLPEGVVLGGPPLALAAPAPGGRDGVGALGELMRVHPARVVLSLAARRIPVDRPAYDPALADTLRDWGLRGAPEPLVVVPAPSLDVDDDPCPRRRHARRVLRRLLRMGKVGPQRHTEFDHLYRGVPADARHEALDVGEALVRAGLLGEKPSVGQRHVYLNREQLPRIHALIDRGETDSPALTTLWTAPAPGAEAAEPTEGVENQTGGPKRAVGGSAR